MKKILMAAAGLIGLGLAPALAADLPARAYTKAPAIVAPIYNWGGFYIGLNGGGGSARKCWDINNFPGVRRPANREGCHDATGGLFGGQVGYRWQITNWVFGLEAQGDWADLKGSNVEPTDRSFRFHQQQQGRRARPVHRPGRLCLEQRALVREGRRRRHPRQVPRSHRPSASPSITPAKPAGAARSAPASNIGFAPGWSVAFEYDHLFMGSHNNFLHGCCAGRRAKPHRQYPPGRRHGHRPRQLPFGGPVVAKY